MANKNWKETIFSELSIHDCTILDIAHNQDGTIDAVYISHQLLKLPRWFYMSKKKNLYSMYKNKSKDPYSYSFIIKNWREGLKEDTDGDL